MLLQCHVYFQEQFNHMLLPVLLEKIWSDLNYLLQYCSLKLYDLIVIYFIAEAIVNVDFNFIADFF